MTKTRIQLVAGAAVACLLLAVVLWPHGEVRPPAAAGDRPQPLAKALISAAGKVEPRSEEVRLGVSITGKLAEVPVEEGDAVRAGQVVARLENADWRARLAEAEATVRIREAELARLLNGARPEERREAEAAVRQAEAVIEQTRRDLARYDTLGKQGWSSPQNLEKTRRDHEVATARLAEARQHLAVVAAEARDDERQRAEAARDLATAQRDEAAAMLAKTEIESPIDGVVLRKHRRIGEMISEAQDMPILSIGDTAVLRVRAEVDETDIARLGLGQSAWVRADAFGEQRFAGHVVRLAAMVGRKKIHTDQPAEKLDDKVLEVLIELDGRPPLPVGLRVDAFIQP
ncbi:MAG TPA: HlyD family efflux transporter periplasmic adaptor subunit [Rhodospirillaceae bacterium]|nr:HlyD family efflux transporter periplasmic adaptor subunit [Rhodospirillaceae bacterium]